MNRTVSVVNEKLYTEKEARGVAIVLTRHFGKPYHKCRITEGEHEGRYMVLSEEQIDKQYN